MSISLTYFDFDGSRGLECRLALCAAGVEFEDIRVARGEWMALKPSLPYGALPLLTDGDRRLTQSTAILGYLGAAHGLHPADPWIAAEHAAIMNSVEDLRHKVPGGRDMPEDEKKTAREAFAAGWLTQWAKTTSERIVGPFVEGDRLNVADIKVYVILRAYLSDGYDHIPASFFDDYPKIKGLFAAVDSHPAVTGYFAAR